MDNKAQEKTGDIIYETLKENGVKENRAFITDIISEALCKAGYHKLPKDKPPLLSDEELWKVGEPCIQDKPCPFGIADEPCGIDGKANDDKCILCGMQSIAQAQREADIKHYEEVKDGIN